MNEIEENIEENWEAREALQLNEQIGLLDANARHLVDQGLHDDAERVYREMSRLSPNNLAAIHYLATRHLARGELEEAQRLIERGVRLDFGTAVWHQHLGIVLRARDYLRGALRAFDQALNLNPKLAVAWIQRGDVLHAMGRKEEGIASYVYAGTLLGNLVNAAADAPPKTSRSLRRAGEIVCRERTRMLADTLQPVRDRHDREALNRAEASVFGVIRGERPDYADPLQKPTGFYFPGLAPQPFFEQSDFSFAHTLKEHSAQITHEIRGLLAEHPSPFEEAPRGPDQTSGDFANSSAYYFYRQGERREEAALRCPETMAAIEELPLAQLPVRLPEVLFFGLDPRERIPPQHGFSNFTLQVLLPLIASRGCGTKTGDLTRVWTPGEALIFDASYEHESWNRAGEPAVALAFTIWHPELTQAERDYLIAAFAGLENFTLKYLSLQSSDSP
ncbi:MAG: aspartyl/asparaginyl beta-hydroxylase domain-containing protein [Gammaproteobacteria bacterium]